MGDNTEETSSMVEPLAGPWAGPWAGPSVELVNAPTWELPW